MIGRIVLLTAISSAAFAADLPRCDPAPKLEDAGTGATTITFKIG